MRGTGRRRIVSLLHRAVTQPPQQSTGWQPLAAAGSPWGSQAQPESQQRSGWSLAGAAADLSGCAPSGREGALLSPALPSLRAVLLQRNSSAGAAAAAAQRRGFATPFRGGKGRAARARQAPADMAGPRHNEQIQAKEVRLVFPQEESRPAVVMSLEDALKEARARKLDLIEVTANTDPLVCRLADYDKVFYELRKKARATEKAAREQKRMSEPKEVRVGCHIAENDLNVKLTQARRFVEDGYHLRLVVTFKNREMALGQEMVHFLLEKLEGLVVVKNPRQLEKSQQNQWVVQLAPAQPQKPAKSA